MTKIQNSIDNKTFYKPSIDSLKLRIPLDELESYDTSLNDTLYTTNQDGIIEEEFKRKSKHYQSNAFSVYASTHNIKVDANTFKPSLVVLLNSKILGSEYFNGLTSDTIQLAFNQLKALGILNCTLDKFLDYSFASDIDIKKDFHLEPDEYKELLKATKEMTRPSSQGTKGYKFYDTGIEWSVRETTKFKTNPFLKIYHKETELLTNSKEFYDMHLQDHREHIINLARIETTIKNRGHLRALNLGLKTFSLKELLNLSHEQLNQIIAKSVNTHLLPRSKAMTFKTEKKMTPTQAIFLRSLVSMTSDKNWGIDKAVSYLIQDIDNKTSKSINKKTLIRLYNDHILNTDYDSKSNKIESVFDGFGWH